MRDIIFELCAETMDACLAARPGGADRIELCSGLSEGGLTPSHGLIRAAVERTGLPVHVLIRPRGGDFRYSDAELTVMLADIQHAKALGAAGVVLGVLRADGFVDVGETRRLVELARPMEVTFHRAFDTTIALDGALEDVVASGCARVLTSGGKRDVVAGAQTLAHLVRQARDRIEVAVGGGLRLQNAASVARLTGALHFHGSLRRRPAKSAGEEGIASPGSSRYIVDADAVRSMVQRLQNA